jgi:hypothetical protein
MGLVNAAERQLIRQSSLFKDASPPGFETILQAGVLRSQEQDSFDFIQGDPATHA